MKKFLLSAVALAALSGTAMAEPAKLNPGQLDEVAGGFLDGYGGFSLVATQDLTQVGSAQTDVVIAQGSGATAALTKAVTAGVSVVVGATAVTSIPTIVTP